jgi:tRNA-dihydrouridine synthase B
MNDYSRYMFAPMAEISTPSLRSVIRRFSPSAILYSEMLSAHLIVHGGKHDRYLTAHGEGERIVYQILGNDPAIMRDAACVLRGENPYGIDINLGCCAPDIMKTKCGGYLLRDRELVRRIVGSVRRSLDIPLSIKMRAGIDAVDTAFTVDFCRMLQDEGADRVIVHGRSTKQGFRGAADWKVVAAVKEALSIEVAGNGDITTADEARARLAEMRCDRVMIGRAAVQKPWLLSLCDNTAVDRVDLSDLCGDILDSLERDLPDELHRSRAHRFLFYYTKNFRFGHPLMSAIRKESLIPPMKKLVEEYCERNPHERFLSLG